MAKTTEAQSKQTTGKTTNRIGLTLLISSIVLLIIAAVAYYLLIVRQLDSWLGLIGNQLSWMNLLFLIIGIGGATLILLLFLRLVPNTTLIYNESSKILAERFSWPKLTCLFIVNGFAEELLFRGALQPAIGLVFSALIFTAIHFDYYKKPLMLVYVLALGLFFGLIYGCTGSVWICAICHVYINMLFIYILKTGSIDYSAEVLPEEKSQLKKDKITG